MKNAKRIGLSLLAMAALALGCMSATGCKEDTDAGQQEEKSQDAKEHPASAKPKDHPAH